MPMRTREEQREYQRQWVAKRRAAYFADKSCVLCGSIQNLELDHIDPLTKDPKLKSGTSLWSWSRERRENEISKCQVLCQSCHLDKTIREDSIRRPLLHGNAGMAKKGCKCDLCQAYIRDSKREWRAKTGKR